MAPDVAPDGRHNDRDNMKTPRYVQMDIARVARQPRSRRPWTEDFIAPDGGAVGAYWGRDGVRLRTVNVRVRYSAAMRLVGRSTPTNHRYLRTDGTQKAAPVHRHGSKRGPSVMWRYTQRVGRGARAVCR